jgi:hypothetical protein
MIEEKLRYEAEKQGASTGRHSNSREHAAKKKEDNYFVKSHSGSKKSSDPSIFKKHGLGKHLKSQISSSNNIITASMKANRHLGANCMNLNT